MPTDDLLERLAAVERRLAEHAGRPAPTGLTDPDPGSDERWRAGQVWGHTAEFPAYWLGQIDHVLNAHRAGEPEPIPFGRTKEDPERIGGIEQGRAREPSELLARVRAGIVAARRFLLRATDADRSVRGLHSTLGEMNVERILEHFIVEHLEEHSAQLDALAVAATREADE
jgi:hypothetical protein